ncbi:MAG: IPT/TIG domain-containing protein, partial [Thermoguttaceae bacterium]
MTETAKLTASDGAAGDTFGYSVSIGGNTVVVGARYAMVGSNSQQGTAYVFTEPSSGWANMTQTAKLTASDGAANNLFGYSVSISGNTVVVGANGAGAAYVFTEPAAGWKNMAQTAKLTASDGTGIGWSVSISGNMVVTGARGATVGGNKNQGAAYVFTEPASGWKNMAQTAKLTASDGAANTVFGWSVSISGNTVVAGAPEATVNGNGNQGAAYVFTEPASGWAGNMTQTAKLTASDGAANNLFGDSVSISGNTVVVGALGGIVMAGSNRQGAAYVFTEPASGWTNMTQTAKFAASDGAADDQFGDSVSISGNTVLVGANAATVGGNSDQGAAYVFATTPRPPVTGVSTTQAAGAYGAGTTIPITVTFSEPVTVTGTPQLALNSGSGAMANYASGSGTSTLTFEYTVAPGQDAEDLDYASTAALTLNGGSIEDAAGNAAWLTLPTPSRGTDSLASNNIVIEAALPVVTGVSPAAGPSTGGTTVTITGTGFAGAMLVAFGSLTASSFTVNSATQITATIPMEPAGTVDVTVVTPGGISPVSSADQFTYFAATAVTGVSPTEGPSAGGTTVTITSSGFTAALLVNFGLFAASSFTVNSDTQITATSPAELAGTVDVTVVTPGGISPVSSADHFTYFTAAVTGVTPTTGPSVGGTTVTIIGTGFTGAMLVAFGSFAASSFTVNSDTQITATSPAELAGTVDVTVVTPSGISRVSSADTFAYLPTPVIVTAGDWTSAGLTLTLGSDGNLHVYTTGTTAPELVPPCAPASVSNIAITSP